MRGRRPLFCSTEHRARFDHRLARSRQLAAALESTARRLAEIDAAAVTLFGSMATGQTAAAELAELALQSANVASGRNQIYLGLMAWLNPAATRYDRGGRPRRKAGTS